MSKKEISDTAISHVIKVTLETLGYTDQEIQDILSGRVEVEQRELKRKIIRLLDGG